MKQRNVITLGAAIIALACLATVSAHAQLGNIFVTNGYKGFAVPGGGGNLYVTGPLDSFGNHIIIQDGMPFTLTNNYGFDITAVSDSLTLVPNPNTGGLFVGVDSNSLLTHAGSVPLGAGNSVSGTLFATVSNGGFPMPDFQLNWTIDLVENDANHTSLGSQSFLIDVSVNPQLEDSSVTPEPSSLSLMAGAALGGAFWLRRRRK